VPLCSQAGQQRGALLTLRRVMARSLG